MVNPDDYTYIVETDYKSLREYKTLQWQTEPPTQSGLYWAHLIDKNEPAWAGKEDVIFVAVIDGKAFYALKEGLEVTHTLGPLPVPEPPKE